MATRIHVHAGRASGVYDDRLAPIYRALGTLHVERATDVEYDPTTQEWVATYRPTRQVIARHANRAAVIRAEVAWLEQNLDPNMKGDPS